MPVPQNRCHDKYHLKLANPYQNELLRCKQTGTKQNSSQVEAILTLKKSTVSKCSLFTSHHCLMAGVSPLRKSRGTWMVRGL